MATIALVAVGLYLITRKRPQPVKPDKAEGDSIHVRGLLSKYINSRRIYIPPFT